MVKQFEQAPPPAAVDVELRAMGITQDDRYPAGFVRLPSGTTLHWTEALTLMRKRAQAYTLLASVQQTPFWRSPTFFGLISGLAVLGSIAITLIQDPVVAQWLPEPLNKVLPVAIALGVVPRMQKWWQEYRERESNALAEQRRLIALGMAGTDETPPTAPALPPPPSQ